ncbi:MAG: hypothetical protein ACHREM_09020 [Polyangiales bacterium]
MPKRAPRVHVACSLEPTRAPEDAWFRHVWRRARARSGHSHSKVVEFSEREEAARLALSIRFDTVDDELTVITLDTVRAAESTSGASSGVRWAEGAIADCTPGLLELALGAGASLSRAAGHTVGRVGAATERPLRACPRGRRKGS